MNRRELIRKVAMGSTTLVVVPALLTSCEKDDGVGGRGGGGSTSLDIDLSLPENAALNNTGGFRIVSNVIVINTGDGNYTALSAVCTHAGCTVSYNVASNNLPCACHGSLFTIGGAVVTGPATSPLSVFPVTKSGNILSVQR